MEASQFKQKDKPRLNEYLLYQRKSFSEEPLNRVDSLVFSTAAFLCFERGILGRRALDERLPLPMAICGVHDKDLFGETWLNDFDGPQFFQAFRQSPRFMECSVGRCVSESNDSADKQFGAVTFYLPDNSVYVAFRGTDGSIKGWREDFNLSFMCQVPSQSAARHYLESVASTQPPHLYVGGHSKGGNLAEYAALSCSDYCFKQIDTIFNHDGPGFAVIPSERFNDPAYLAKLDKTVPGNSIIGMFMEQRSIQHVIEAKGVFVMEHASTNWYVPKGDFEYLPAIEADARVVVDALNKWTLSCEPQERSFLVGSIFDLLESTGAKTLNDVGDNFFDALANLFDAAASFPESQRKEVRRLIRDMLAALCEGKREHMKKRIRDILDRD